MTNSYHVLKQTVVLLVFFFFFFYKYHGNITIFVDVPCKINDYHNIYQKYMISPCFLHYQFFFIVKYHLKIMVYECYNHLVTFFNLTSMISLYLWIVIICIATAIFKKKIKDSINSMVFVDVPCKIVYFNNIYKSTWYHHVFWSTIMNFVKSHWTMILSCFWTNCNITMFLYKYHGNTMIFCELP